MLSLGLSYPSRMQGSWSFPRVENRALARQIPPGPLLPTPHPHASSSWPSPGARPTLAALLPAPARGAYERYVRSGPGRRPGKGDEGTRASAASPPPPHIAQPWSAVFPSRILAKLGSSIPCLTSSLGVQALEPHACFSCAPSIEQLHRLKEAILHFLLWV